MVRLSVRQYGTVIDLCRYLVCLSVPQNDTVIDFSVGLWSVCPSLRMVHIHIFIYYVKNRAAFNRAIRDGKVLQMSDLKDGIAIREGTIPLKNNIN